MTEATLSAKVTADIADFTKKFASMQQSIDALADGSVASSGRVASAVESATGGAAKKVSEQMKFAASAAIGVATAVEGSFFAIAKSVSASTEKIQQIAEQTGMAASTLEQWQPILARTNTSVQSFAQGYKALSKDIVAAQGGQQDAIDKFAAMGLAVNALGNTDEVIAALADRLSGIGDPAQRAQVAVDFLGKAGMNLIPALAGGSRALIESGEQAKRWGLALTDVQRTDLLRFDDALDDLGSAFDGLKTQIAIAVTPALQAIADMVQGGIEWFGKLEGGVKQVVGVFGTAFAAGGPVVLAAVGVAAAMGVAFAPILIGGATVVALIAAVTLIIANWQTIKDAGTAIWNGAKNAVVAAARGIYEGVVEWIVNKTSAITNKVWEFAKAVASPFEWLKDHLVTHSVVPDMVQDIKKHMELLDVAMSSPARNATKHTGDIIEGAVFTWQSAINQFTSTVNFGWGSMTQTLGSSLAQMTTDTVNWATVGVQMGQQFLGNMINLALQLVTQWVIAEATRTAATVTGAAVQTAAVTTAAGTMAAANAAAATTSVSVWAGASVAIVGFFGAVAGGFAAIAGGLVAAVVAVGTFVMGVLEAIAAALTSSIFGIPFAGAIVAGIAAIAVALAATDNLPGFAKGGITFGPAVFGEAGPEAAIPLNGRGASFMQEAFGFGSGSGSGGGTQTIIIQMDGREIARTVMQYMDGIIRMKLGR